jgi:polyisoprenyl-teichoic acid--peptidoglycan teichoic acid transferase
MSLKRKLAIFTIRMVLIILIVAFPLFALGFASFLVVKTYNVSRAISSNQTEKSTEEQNFEEKKQDSFDAKSKAQEIVSQAKQLAGWEKLHLDKGEEGRVNILLLGKASEDYPGSALTDTIILTSFDPQTNKAAMLSLPRDLYAPIPESKQFTKLNAIYHYGLKKGGEEKGIQFIKEAVKEITGQSVDYFIMLDFKGFTELVNEIGGIRINVTKELTDHRYPGPNYSYQLFHIDEGWQSLNGETALKYVRTRHNPGGDFGRAFRQQQVLGAIKEKFFSLNNISLLSKLNAILNIISENVKTDIKFSEYGSFLALAKNINVHNIINKVLDNRGENPILVSSSSWIGRSRAYFLKPTAGDYSQIKEIAENIFSLDKLRKSWEEQQAEKPSILINNGSGNYSLLFSVRKTLTEAGYKKITAGEQISETLPETLIYDNSEGLKPYSLNALSKILDAQVKLEKYPEAENFDLVIILGDEAREIFEKEDVVLPKEAFEQEEY